MRMKRMAIILLTVMVCGGAFPADKPSEKPTTAKQPDPAFAPIQDVQGLPRVLLIGDSISIGYTLPVRELLKGKANVHRIPVNGGPTSNGLAHLKEWLDSGKWDVIHFNWGLHDLKYMKDGHQQVPVEAYEKNLETLVGILKQTEAKLIWASTTPVPAGANTPLRKSDDVVAYNAAAQRVMERNGVKTDDLYAFALPQIQAIQRPQNVHYTDAGSKVLAEQVAKSILGVL